MGTPQPHNMASLTTAQKTEIIVAVQQARYRQQQAFDDEDDKYVEKNAYHKDVVVEVEALGVKHEGVAAAIESAKETRESLGQAATQVANLIVTPIDATHAESSDRSFSYNGGDGTLRMIVQNKIQWAFEDDKWLITNVAFMPVWVS